MSIKMTEWLLINDIYLSVLISNLKIYMSIYDIFKYIKIKWNLKQIKFSEGLKKFLFKKLFSFNWIEMSELKLKSNCQ